MYTGLKGKYMSTQMRIVLYAGSGVKRKIPMITTNYKTVSLQTEKKTSLYQDVNEFVLTGWEF